MFKSMFGIMINLINIYLNYLVITVLCDPTKLNYYSDKYIVVDRKNYTEQLGYIDGMLFNYRTMEYHYKEKLIMCGTNEKRLEDLLESQGTQCTFEKCIARFF